MGPPAQGTLRLGYNTNGFAHHRLLDAIDQIAAIGYRAIGITLDIHHLDPFAASHRDDLKTVAEACRERDLQVVVETGARFLLDPARKHHPTLVSASPVDRQRRLDFYLRAAEAAYALVGPPFAPILSLWSGAADDGAPPETLDDRLADGLARLTTGGVTIAFEPEPGMHIEDMAGYTRIKARVPALRLTLDVGHAHITEPDGADATIRAFAADLANVQLEGMRKPVHDHLPPWDGDLDVRSALATLRAVGYRGPACLELSRHSHDAVRIARRAFEYLLAPPLVE
jgi:sugar phosphate isomerase/epimerase